MATAVRKSKQHSPGSGKRKKKWEQYIAGRCLGSM